MSSLQVAMSSFRRKVSTTGSKEIGNSNNAGETNLICDNQGGGLSSSVPISGWKPAVYSNLGLVSSGHRALDDILSGGLMLGSIILYVNEDTISNYGLTLLAYNVAESLSHSHKTLVIGASGYQVETLMNLLPKNVNLDRIISTANRDVDETRVESNPNENANETSEKQQTDSWGLKIAWQYEKYLSEYSIIK